MATTFFLPTEIRDAIIDEVGSNALIDTQWTPDYRQTLESFHAASTGCRQRALIFLYKEIQILKRYKSVEDGAKKRILKLRQLIDPPVASRLGGVGRYIKSASFSFSGDHQYRSDDRFFLDGRFQLDDILHDENLVFVFQSLAGGECGVENLTLQFIPASTVHPQAISWTALPPAFRVALRGLIRSPNLVSLDVENITQAPLAILEGCANLKTLALGLLPAGRVSHGWGQEDTESKVPKYPQLETLVTDHSHPLSRAPSAILKNLKVLSAYGRDALRTSEIINIAGNSLQFVDLEHSGDMILGDLGQMPNLKIFSYAHIRSARYRYDDADLKRLYELLKVPNPMQSLTEIHLSMLFNENGGSEGFLHPDDVVDPHWTMMSEVLSSAMYPALRCVTVCIEARVIVGFSVEFDNDEFKRTTTAFLQPCFQGLSQSERISFSLEVKGGGDAVMS